MSEANEVKREFKVGDKVRVTCDLLVRNTYGVLTVGNGGVTPVQKGDTGIIVCIYRDGIDDICVKLDTGKTVNVCQVFLEYVHPLEKEALEYAKNVLNTYPISISVNVSGLDAYIMHASGVDASLYNGANNKEYVLGRAFSPNEAVYELAKKIASDYIKTHDKKPEFTHKDLKTGMFGKTCDGCWFVVVNDRIVYEDEDYNELSNCEFDTRDYKHYSVELIMNAVSFAHAKRLYKDNNISAIVWKRES